MDTKDKSSSVNLFGEETEDPLLSPFLSSSADNSNSKKKKRSRPGSSPGSTKNKVAPTRFRDSVKNAFKLKKPIDTNRNTTPSSSQCEYKEVEEDATSEHVYVSYDSSDESEVRKEKKRPPPPPRAPPPANLGKTKQKSVYGALDNSTSTSVSEVKLFCADSKEALYCRICAGGEEDGPLISPCKCSGSMSYIHPECLQKWIEQRPNTAQGEEALVCEVCHTRYAVAMRLKYVGDCDHICSCSSWAHIIEGFILIFCVAAMVGLLNYMFSKSNPASDQVKPFEMILLFCLVGLSVVMSMVALRRVYDRWITSVSEVSLEIDESLRDNMESNTVETV